VIREASATAVRTFLVLLVLPATAPTPALADAPPDSYTAGVDTLPLGFDLFEAPVYYELTFPQYFGEGDLEHLRAGRVPTQHYPPVDAADFAWNRAGSEYTWWMQMQEMRFILPLIASDRGSDRALAKDWLARWYRVHLTGNVPVHKWGEPMTFAYRSMVFVYYFKVEQSRARPDPDVVAMLSASIWAHQKYLMPDGNFDESNNHGMIDALGLLETTRVFPNRGARSLALQRMRRMVAKLVSADGVQMEQAAGYHFAFLGWVDEILTYTRGLPDVRPAFITEMASASRRMRRAAYFLQDHRGGIPPIGDTDSVTVYYYSSAYRFQRPVDNATSFYDLAAGYAIFKGRGRGRDSRYVVFRQPSRRDAPLGHAHSDALSVFVASDGEVLLGDAGRYSYTPASPRDYFLSQPAHNTVLPPGRPGVLNHTNLPLVAAARDMTSPDTTMWTADLVFDAGRVTRVVRIPAGGREIVVHDTLSTTGRAASPDAPAPRTMTVLWNIGQDVERLVADPRVDEDTWSWKLTTRRGKHARLELTVRGDGAPACADIDVVKGQQRPLLGWYSPRQYVMRPVSVIVATMNVDSNVYLETRVRFPRRR
jgi:hypothetical protein